VLTFFASLVFFFSYLIASLADNALSCAIFLAFLAFALAILSCLIFSALFLTSFSLKILASFCCALLS